MSNQLHLLDVRSDAVISNINLSGLSAPIVGLYFDGVYFWGVTEDALIQFKVTGTSVHEIESWTISSGITDFIEFTCITGDSQYFYIGYTRREVDLGPPITLTTVKRVGRFSIKSKVFYGVLSGFNAGGSLGVYNDITHTGTSLVTVSIISTTPKSVDYHECKISSGALLDKVTKNEIRRCIEWSGNYHHTASNRGKYQTMEVGTYRLIYPASASYTLLTARSMTLMGQRLWSPRYALNNRQHSARIAVLTT
jgi:hypothetical protein